MRSIYYSVGTVAAIRSTAVTQAGESAAIREGMRKDELENLINEKCVGISPSVDKDLLFVEIRKHSFANRFAEKCLGLAKPNDMSKFRMLVNASDPLAPKVLQDKREAFLQELVNSAKNIAEFKKYFGKEIAEIEAAEVENSTSDPKSEPENQHAENQTVATKNDAATSSETQADQSAGRNPIHFDCSHPLVKNLDAKFVQSFETLETVGDRAARIPNDFSYIIGKLLTSQDYTLRSIYHLDDALKNINCENETFNILKKRILDIIDTDYYIGRRGMWYKSLQ